jgi:hypothetical protein
MTVSIILQASSRARPGLRPPPSIRGANYSPTLSTIFDVIPGFRPSVCICGTQEREDVVMIGGQRPADRIGQTVRSLARAPMFRPKYEPPMMSRMTSTPRPEVRARMASAKFSSRSLIASALRSPHRAFRFTASGGSTLVWQTQRAWCAVIPASQQRPYCASPCF